MNWSQTITRPHYGVTEKNWTTCTPVQHRRSNHGPWICLVTLWSSPESEEVELSHFFLCLPARLHVALVKYRHGQTYNEQRLTPINRDSGQRQQLFVQHTTRFKILDCMSVDGWMFFGWLAGWLTAWLAGLFHMHSYGWLWFTFEGMKWRLIIRPEQTEKSCPAFEWVWLETKYNLWIVILIGLYLIFDHLRLMHILVRITKPMDAIYVYSLLLNKQKSLVNFKTHFIWRRSHL